MGAARRVLVVDDDPSTVDMLALVLDLEGYDVVRAQRGMQAMEKLRDRPPDALVLDLMMPGMSGYEVLRELRSDPELSSTPVLVLTALDRDVDVWSGWMAGADAYVTKPMDVGLLLSELERILLERDRV